MIRAIGVLAAATALSACSMLGRDSTPDPIPSQAENACGASQYLYLVGRNRSEIPAAPAGAVWRVHSTTDAVTMDYNPRRLNIVWDAKTEVVRTVSCG